MTSEQSVLDSVPKQLYIGGAWVDASGGATFEVEDPATGQALCSVADATPEDAKAVLDAAVAAQAGWAATPPNERSEILHRAFLALGPLQALGVERNEAGAERALAEQATEGVGQPEGDEECIGLPAGAHHPAHQHFAGESRDAADQGQPADRARRLDEIHGRGGRIRRCRPACR